MEHGVLGAFNRVIVGSNSPQLPDPSVMVEHDDDETESSPAPAKLA